MKRINILVMIILLLLSTYLGYRLFANDGFNRGHTIQLILTTLFGGINSVVVYYQRREEEKNAK